MSRISQYKLLLILAAVVLCLDQVTKYWINATLEVGSFFPPDNIVVIPGFFNIVHVRNTGAAWSILTGYTWMLTIIGFIALYLIFVFRKALELKKPYFQLCFGLIIGGIIGNLIDRIHLQGVIDFLDFHYQDHHFPSFNIADSGITVGVTLYVVFSIFRKEEQ